MGKRKKRAPRCERCRLHNEDCLCASITRHDLKTKLALVMHHREWDKPTATGPLALQALTNSELFLHGLRDAPLDLRKLSEENRRVCILFPREGARVLTREFIAEDARPITLVVPDGSWRQAKRIPARVPGLDSCECVVLADGAATQWGVRRETVEGGLATLEAIARAFGVLESAEIQKELETLFLAHANATRNARGEDTDAEEERHDARPDIAPLTILYQDEYLVAVHKPSGLLTHRGWGHDENAAVQQIRDQIGRFVYPVHRLDRSTSGVLLFALTSEVNRDLQPCFARGEVEKRYLAFCRGHDPTLQRVEHPLAEENQNAQDAITDFRFLGAFERYGLYEALPRTGRTHQIRRHLKHVSQPIVGDVRYGNGEHNRILRTRFDFRRLALHCHRLTFVHPRTRETVVIRAPLDADFASLLRATALFDAATAAMATTR